MAELVTDFDHNALSTRAQADHLFADMHASCPVFHSESWGDSGSRPGTPRCAISDVTPRPSPQGRE